MAVNSRHPSDLKNPEGLDHLFAAARRPKPLPDRLEAAILRDAAAQQADFVQPPEAGPVLKRLPAAALTRWRHAALLAASAAAGLVIGLSSASAVESLAASISSGSETVGADIFSGLDALLAEE